jgi:hypothetical protein
MPAKRIPDLTAISGASTANDDNLVIFDTDADETKRILRSQLAAGLVGDLPYTPAGFISATTIPTAIAEIASDVAASSGSSLVGFLPAGLGAVATTVQAKLRETVSVKDFGAVGDGVADDTAAIQAALSASKSVLIPPSDNFYKITAPLNCPAVLLRCMLRAPCCKQTPPALALLSLWFLAQPPSPRRTSTASR